MLMKHDKITNFNKNRKNIIKNTDKTQQKNYKTLTTKKYIIQILINAKLQTLNKTQE